MKISNTGHIILIGGGSSVGKTSAVSHLKDINIPPVFFNLDYDDQLLKLCNLKFEKNIPEALSYLINQLPAVARKGSFVMDHWMPPKYEKQARKALLNYQTFYVWLFCSSINELKRRETIRSKRGDYRGEGITEAGAELLPTIPYHCKLDTFSRTPEIIAQLIHKEARKHWGYNT